VCLRQRSTRRGKSAVDLTLAITNRRAVDLIYFWSLYCGSYISKHRWKQTSMYGFLWWSRVFLVMKF
jgi:hypothetical protein